MMNLDYSFLTREMLVNYVAGGVWFSLTLTAVAALGGLVLGTLLAVARLSPIKPLSWLAGAYIDTLRAIPLVMVILWVFLLVPLLIGQSVGAERSAFITFTLFEAAYYAEIMRAGIHSVPRGQSDAARAMGLAPAQTFTLVVLPQALRNMLPVLMTQTIILFQDTSLVYVIGAGDMLKGMETLGRNTNRPVEMYLIAAATYFAVCFALSMLVRRLSRKIAIIR